MRIKDVVKRILSEIPETRDSDKLLILYVWQAQGLVFTPEQIQAYKKVASSETIRRIRQKFQEEGLYRASDDVEEARYNKFVETKDAIATEPSAVSWLND